MPKCQSLPFFAWCISGSRLFPAFFVDGGASKIVASTMHAFLHHQPALAQLDADLVEQLSRQFVIDQQTPEVQQRGGIRHILARQRRYRRTHTSQCCRTARLQALRPTGRTTVAENRFAASAPTRPADGPARLSGNTAQSPTAGAATAAPSPSPPGSAAVSSRASYRGFLLLQNRSVAL